MNMMNMNFSPEMMNLNYQVQNIKNNLDFIGLPINLVSISLFNLTKTGIQTLNIGIEILNLCLEYTKQNMLINNNIKTTFQNIILQIKNLELVLNNYELNPNLMFQNEMMMNMGIMNNVQINDSFIPKMNVTFITKNGKTNLIINRNTSVKDCINKFFESRIDLKEDRDILFIFNGMKINENNNIDVWTFFGEKQTVSVSVIDQAVVGG